MSSSLRAIAFFSLTSALLIGLASPGCSQQGEGERCDNLRAGDSDCDSGLVCTQARLLLDESTDRCCKEDKSYDDARCTPSSGGGSGPMNAAGADGQNLAGSPDAGGGSSGGAPAGGAPTELPVEQAGQPAAAGMSSASPDAGAGGMSSTPAGGQGGAG